MRSRLACWLAACAALALLCGCAGRQNVVYQMVPPASDRVAVAGLPVGWIPMELTDQCGAARATGDTLLLVGREGASWDWSCYALGLGKGQARKLMDLPIPAPQQPAPAGSEVSYFWDDRRTLEISSEESSRLCCSILMPFGKAPLYGFECRKELVPSAPGSLVFVSSRKLQYNSALPLCCAFCVGNATATDAEVPVIEFQRGGEIIPMTEAPGFPWLPGVRARVYSVSDSLALGMFPEKVGENGAPAQEPARTLLFEFDLERRAFRGGEYPMSEGDRTLDFGVAPDKSAAVFLVVRDETLYLTRTNPAKLAAAIRDITARMEGAGSGASSHGS
jgi:hypothetical protein